MPGSYGTVSTPPIWPATAIQSTPCEPWNLAAKASTSACEASWTTAVLPSVTSYSYFSIARAPSCTSLSRVDHCTPAFGHSQLDKLLGFKLKGFWYGIDDAWPSPRRSSPAGP